MIADTTAKLATDVRPGDLVVEADGAVLTVVAVDAVSPRRLCFILDRMGRTHKAFVAKGARVRVVAT